MRIAVTSKDNLAQVLSRAGFAPDLRCGGRGNCGRCGVRLLSGEWTVAGKHVAAVADALSCQTRLESERGEVEFTPLRQNGNISADWNTAPLPVRPETVIGVDIGTTTVAAVKIRAGEVVGTASCFNAQSRYGDNVITRINQAATELDGLRMAVQKSVGELLARLGTEGVSRIAVAGNTVMSCLFHGVDPTSIGMLPFTPPMRIFPRSEWDGIPLLTVPCISGYIGGDLTAGLRETNPGIGEMLVDVGTNCEILCNTPDGVICAAAAAGPAFEGAGLSFGSRAASGALDHYRSREDYTVLGGGEATGFCGSAYLDFLAEERRNGRLNEFGRFEPKADRMWITDRIFVNERDIEQLLKAKAAVWAGIRTFEQYCGRQADRIYLAGGFARYLNLENAVAVGMLPERNYEIVGNTSLAGAARLAAAPEILPELERLIDRPREIPLNTVAGFEDNFIDGLLLP